jgi:hypothetical protein
MEHLHRRRYWLGCLNEQFQHRAALQHQRYCVLDPRQYDLEVWRDLNDSRLTATPFFAASGGRWQFRVVNTSNNRSTTITNGGNEIASLLIGVPNSVDVRPLIFDYDYRWKGVAAFVQNDWR